MGNVVKVPLTETNNHKEGRGPAGPTIKRGPAKSAAGNPTKGGGINRATQG